MNTQQICTGYLANAVQYWCHRKKKATICVPNDHTPLLFKSKPDIKLLLHMAFSGQSSCRNISVKLITESGIHLYLFPCWKLVSITSSFTFSYWHMSSTYQSLKDRKYIFLLFISTCEEGGKDKGEKRRIKEKPKNWELYFMICCESNPGVACISKVEVLFAFIEN